jgi:hypothetical protein
MPRDAIILADVFTQNRRLWVRLHEKGGKAHAMPCHHNFEDYLTAYLNGANLRGDPKGPLFRTIGRGTATLRSRVSHPIRSKSSFLEVSVRRTKPSPSA